MAQEKAHILVVGNFPTKFLTGHQVQTASGYDEAIEILNMKDFDVIIMDAVINTTIGHRFIVHVRDNCATPTILRYGSAHILIPEVGKTWAIIPSINACFRFVSPIVMDKDERKHICSKVEEILEQALA